MLSNSDVFGSPRCSRSWKNTAGRIHSGDMIIQCAVGAVVVVVQSAVVNHPADVCQVQEQISVQEFVTKLIARQFDTAIFYAPSLVINRVPPSVRRN